jgi:hypothetical protein
MDSKRTIHPILPLTLALLLPACVIDTKLIDNPSTGGDDDSTTEVTEGDTSTTTGDLPGTGTTDTTVAPETGTTVEPDTDTGIGEGCELPGNSFEWVVVSNADETWLEPIDETCTVVSGVSEGNDLELHLDCPQHAIEHGEFVLVLTSGPTPAVVPQVGEPLEVYFQPLVDSFIDSPQPELLFLRSEGVLLYASALGFYVGANGEAAAVEHLAPLTVDVEPGPCPLLDNPDWLEGSDGFDCKREARGMLLVTSPDDGPQLLVEAQVGTHHVGSLAYTSYVMLARVGEECVDVDLEKFAYTIALTEVL